VVWVGMVMIFLRFFMSDLENCIEARAEKVV
jgi:hypothetical protein